MTHMFPNEGASSSSTSVGSQKSETNDDKMIAMVLEEEYAQLDGAMAKRLSNLTSIPVRYCMHVLIYLFLFSFPSLVSFLFRFVLPSSVFPYPMLCCWLNKINCYLTLLSFGHINSMFPGLTHTSQRIVMPLRIITAFMIGNY